ncbi:SNF2 family DNA or RNA helicase [Variovorax sp. GrIS 2.14]|uniref:DEAD/DEAH box helicase n=1 Tax=Variovorax sp. GrIS 2.14 TaxID=3071709 RepID=UPI0038F6014F
MSNPDDHLTSTAGAIWESDGTRLKLHLPSGGFAEASAADIFKAEFGRSTPSSPEAGQRPSSCLPGMTFSREAAPVALWVRDSAGAVYADIGVVTDAGFVPLETDADQLVFKDRWYPIHLSGLAETRAWATRLQIAPGLITVGGLVALRAASERPCELLDEVTSTATSMASAVAETAPPEGLVADLYAYQRSGIAFLQAVAQQGVGCILGDEMGLGKTLQVIALLQDQRNSNRGPSLVVAPATLLVNWRRELNKFAPELTVLLHAGSGRAGIAGRLGQEDVTLVSYETAIRDEALLSAIAWNVLALDEAQNIKNPEALRTLAVKGIRRRVSVAVTGTPMENTLDDLWSITDFALPGLLGSLQAFKSRFSDAEPDAARLAPVVAPVLLRRLVADVAKDLPQKIEIPQALEMPVPLAQAYDELRLLTLQEYGPAGALVATSRLRMLCAHPSLVIPWDADPAHEMPKYARTMELLEEIFSSNEKALVFSTYQGIADLFMADVPRRLPGNFYRSIDGRVPVPERQQIVDDFFAYEGPGALFLNPKAAGSGLNITAANHVIHYNNEWNPALTAQASARAFRRRQTRPVTIHHLYFLDTVEEVIRDASGFKQALAANAVVGHEGDASPLQMARALQISPLSKQDRR